MTIAKMTTRRDFLKWCGAAGLVAAAPGMLVPLAEASAGPGRQVETRLKMGTIVNLTLVTDSKDQAQAALDAAWRELDRLTAVFDRHRGGTLISDLNDSGRIAGPTPEMLEVLEEAARVHHRSLGAYDPTVLPLLELLEASFQKSGQAPSPNEVRDALRLVDFGAVKFGRGEVALKGAGQRLSLDSVAKGYIVDRMGAAIASQGVKNALIDAGGDILAMGFSHLGRPWRVAVQDPFHPDKYLRVIALSDRAAATSGSYEVFFDQEKKNHHLIDPANGRSADRLVSSTILAPTTAQADAMSTAVFVKPDMIESAEGLIVSANGRQSATPGFKRLIQTSQG